ncbi:hypothetical protein TNCV_1928951 [Trichonephila clavipes]|nr:hypothetical protein TNCV_1928951 [Trichonephila clavipes]
MNSLRFCESVLCGGQKLILRLKTTLGTLQHVPRGRVGQKIWTGVKPTVSSANIAKCDRSVCGISFTYRVNNRLNFLAEGRFWSRRGERFINSHSERTIGEEAMNGLDQGEESQVV